MTMTIWGGVVRVGNIIVVRVQNYTLLLARISTVLSVFYVSTRKTEINKNESYFKRYTKMSLNNPNNLNKSYLHTLPKDVLIELIGHMYTTTYTYLETECSLMVIIRYKNDLNYVKISLPNYNMGTGDNDVATKFLLILSKIESNVHKGRDRVVVFHNCDGEYEIIFNYEQKFVTFRCSQWEEGISTTVPLTSDTACMIRKYLSFRAQ